MQVVRGKSLAGSLTAREEVRQGCECVVSYFDWLMKSTCGAKPGTYSKRKPGKEGEENPDSARCAFARSKERARRDPKNR